MSTSVKNLSYILLLLLAVPAVACSRIVRETQAIEANNRALELYNTGYYTEAIDVFREALRNKKIMRSTKGLIYRNMALCFSQMNEVDSSRLYYGLAIRNSELGSYESLLNRGELYLIDEQADSAVYVFEKAIQIDPERGEVYTNLALVYMGEYDEAHTDPEKALPYSLKALELGKTAMDYYNAGLNYFMLDKYAEADTYFDKGMSAVTNNADMLTVIGRTKYELGKKAEADRIFEKVIALDPEYAEVIELHKALVDGLLDEDDTEYTED